MPLPTPTLHTDRLRLRPFADRDADAIFALQSNARVLRYWDAPPWTQRSQADAFLAACRKMAEDGTGARFAIETRADNAFVGWCSLFRWNPVYRSLGIGYCLDEPVWGQGYATETVRAMLQWAYATLDLNRVEAELDTRNAASARVLEKLGFVREGLKREDCIVSGEVSDTWIYGLLKREWDASANGDPDELPNLGPKSRAMLASVGITSIGQLRELGAVAAYAKVKRAHAKASLNLLWALEGALTGLSWQHVAKEHRTSLLLALEAHETDT